MAIIVDGVVGATAVLAGVPVHWRRKRMTYAFVWHRGWWGWRQRPVAPKFPVGFPSGRDHRAPSRTTGRVSRG
jgi:hypothetical protein